MRSWYDYLADNDGESEDPLCWDTLEVQTKRIHALIDKEVERLGDASKIFLGGASQGACAALHVAMTYPGKFGGLIAAQGHLLSGTKVPSDWAGRGIPVRVFNGLADETMPWHKWVSATYDRLRASGCDIKFVLSKDVEHGDDEAEGKWVRSFFGEMLPSGDVAQAKDAQDCKQQ